jgi:hypothetical protein
MQMTHATRRRSRVACFILLAGLGYARVASAQDMDACIAASEKAVGLQKTGKLIDARASLSTCSAASCPDAIRTSCQDRITQVNHALPSLVFFARDASGRDVTAIKLLIDGVAYADHLDGSAIVLDPGEHEFRFQPVGQPPVVKRLVLHQGEQNRREDLVIGGVSVPIAPAVVPVPVVPSVIAAPIPVAPPPAGDQGTTSHGSGQRTLGLVVGGVGVAGLVVGGVLGGLTLSARSSYLQDCGSNIGAPPGKCNAQGVSGESSAATKGTVSTIAFIAGGAATAAGVILYFTAPKGGTSTQVGLGPSSVWLTGRF